jgi:hypothetical protein
LTQLLYPFQQIISIFACVGIVRINLKSLVERCDRTLITLKVGLQTAQCDALVVTNSGIVSIDRQRLIVGAECGFPLFGIVQCIAKTNPRSSVGSVLPLFDYWLDSHSDCCLEQMQWININC